MCFCRFTWTWDPWDQKLHITRLTVGSPGSNPPLGVAVNLLGTVNVFEAVKALCADGASKLKGACSWTAWF